MTLVVAKHGDIHLIISDLKNQMIRKFGEITSSPALIQKMETGGHHFDSPPCIFECLEKTVTRRFRPLVVIVENTAEVLPNRRMKSKPHLARKARNSSMNSSSGIPFTNPDQSSSPRRIASVRLSSLESFGSAPSKLSKIIAARSARSPSFNFIASIPISKSFIK